jgi:hypothetical protein
MMTKLKTALLAAIKELEEPNSKDFLDFEAFGSVLNRLGIFQNLVFEKIEGKLAVSVNPMKMNPTRLSKEIAFHEMIWRILSALSGRENLVPNSLILNVLMIALEGKASLKSRVKCLDGKKSSFRLTFRNIRSQIRDPRG